MKNIRRFVSAVCLFALAACAGPVTMSPQGSRFEIQQETEREKELAFKRLIEDQDRVFDITFPILAANSDFCGETTAPSFGMSLWNLESQKQEYHQAVANLYNLHAQLAVQHVAPQSPAARAGLRSGDLIVAINGENIPHGYNAAKVAYKALALVGYKQADILFERDGQLIRAIVQPVRVCSYPVLLDSESNDINAYADGKRIVISKGIIRFAESDNEIAMVIAHELGHSAMNHIKKQQENAMIGGLGGLAIDVLLASAGVNTGSKVGQLGQELGGAAYSVQFEQEADYVGMYFMERAGFNSVGVADFWRRMAADDPKSVSVRTTHPTSPERFIAIERTHKEIVVKKAQGADLVPNLKPR